MTAPSTIADLFFERAREFSDRPFLHTTPETARVYDLDRTDWTYGDAVSAVKALACDFAQLRAGEGVRIGLALENRPEAFLYFLALNACGASILPLNCAMQPDEFLHQVEHGDCALIIAAPAHRAKVEAVAARAKNAPAVIGSGEGWFVSALQGSSRSDPAMPGAREAALLYTSGTTGKPKGCILSNDYFLAIARHYTTLDGHVVFERGRERILTPLPVTHMNALACSFMAAIETGGCLIQLDRFHPKIWWKTVRDSEATIIHYLGVMPAMLLTAPETPADDCGGRIRFAFGAGCDPRHHDAFERRFGIPLIEAWAMTETGAGAWITANWEPRKVGTRAFGRAPAGLAWRIVDEDGRDCAPGAPGELLVRRRGADPRLHFFSGYLKDDAATAEAWRDGWFHTGDSVSIDDDGHFHFVDRLKNIIRRSGENIAAIEVESVLMRSPRVAACVVVPIPDDIRGEEVMALILAADDATDESAAREAVEFAAARLAYFKAPGFVAFIDAIPMTASEKVNRGEAKRLARALMTEACCFDFRSLKKSART